VKTLYMLDTNTLSYIASGRSQAARTEYRRMANDADAQLCISVMTEAEVRYGMNKRAHSQARRDALEGLFSTLEILPWSSEEAAIYARALPQLQAKGISVSLMDVLIGAHAAAVRAVLVTHNGIFPRIAQMMDIQATADWAKDL
jgi:tRNA(fMet)-specific endonuclease VapC